MNPTVIAAKTSRPRCPNHVAAPTRMTSPSASSSRQGARAGKYAIAADAPAETLMAIVRTKSTTSAPIGINDQPSPKASPTAADAPPPCG
jgi:hypothetical protein